MLEWEERYRIAVGICKALEYIHDGSPQPVIHMKSSPPTSFYPMTSDLMFFLHLITKTKNGTLKELHLHELCVILLKKCSSSEV